MSPTGAGSRKGSIDATTVSDHQSSPRSATRALLWSALMAPPTLMAFGLLTLGGFAGLFVRPAADDWCTVGKIHAYGYLGMVHNFYALTNGRLANGIASALVYADGLLGARLLPFALAAALFVGLFALLFIPMQRIRWQWPVAPAAFIASVVSALTLFAGNRVYQVAYWPAGSLTHTLPAVLGVWCAAFALAASSKRKWVRFVAFSISWLTAFAIGTLSEPFFLVSGVYAVAGLGVAAVAFRRDRRFRFFVAWLSTWIVGLLAGFIVLYTSPGLNRRTDVSAVSATETSLLSPTGLAEVVRAWTSTWRVIGTEPAYYAAITAGLIVGLLGSSSKLSGVSMSFVGASRSGGGRTMLLLFPAILVVVASFGVATGLTHGYGPTGWKYERAWTNFLVPALLTAALYAVVIGYWLGNRMRSWRSARFPAMIALLALSAVFTTAALASIVPRNWDLAQEMTIRAHDWDINNAAVERQIREGRRVVQFTPHPIANSTEPFKLTAPGTDWVDTCVALYYGVDGLVPSDSWLSSPASEDYRAKMGQR